MAHGHAHSESCSCALNSGGVSQTLEELDFERGLWSAALNGEEERVKKLLATGSNPNALDSSGYTPLHYASRSGHTTSCRLLLTSGANVNAQTPGGVTPLHRAAYCGHVDTVRLLLDHRADTSKKDSDGKTPLHKAAERGHYSVAELLVTFCPSVIEEKDGKGQSAREMVKDMTDNWRALLCKD